MRVEVYVVWVDKSPGAVAAARRNPFVRQVKREVDRRVRELRAELRAALR